MIQCLKDSRRHSYLGIIDVADIMLMGVVQDIMLTAVVIQDVKFIAVATRHNAYGGGYIIQPCLGWQQMQLIPHAEMEELV